MSNVEIISRAYAAMSKGDISGVFADFHDDIRWTEAAGFVYAGTFTGPDAIMTNVFVPMGTEWDPYIVEPETLIGDGDRVAVLGWYSGTFKATGTAFRARFTHWWTVSEGKIRGFEQVVDSVKVAEAVSPGQGGV